MLAVAGITGHTSEADKACVSRGLPGGYGLWARASFLRALRAVPEVQGRSARWRHYSTYCVHAATSTRHVACRVPRCLCTPGYTLLKLDNSMPLCWKSDASYRAERANGTSDNESEGAPLTAS